MKIQTILLLNILLFSITGCGTVKYVPYENSKTEYVVKVDTTIIKDSVFVDRWRKADTVYLTKEKYKYITKVKIDTLHRVDTINVIKEVEVEKPYVPEYYHRVNTGFWILLVGLVISIAGKIYFKLKR